MPLYEYKCRKCSKRFEFLVMGSEKPCCPKCNGRDLERLFSTFAVSGAERKSESDSFGDSGGSDFGGDSDLGSGAGDLGGGDDLGGDLGGADPGGGDLSGDSGGSDSWSDD
jgi:putative FmdB family regulatory protein